MTRQVPLAVLSLLSLPFAAYAAHFAYRAATSDLSTETYLIATGAAGANGALTLHMALGAVLTAVAPLQLIPAIRHRAPAVHRWTGRVLTASAAATGVAGLAFIALRGTIGGWPMDAGFAAYGALTTLTATMTFAAARRRDTQRHRRWALRLFVLIMGSWAFRALYVLWFAATGGAGSTDSLTGPFDRTMVLAFWLPWLALLELKFAGEARRRRSIAGHA